MHIHSHIARRAVGICMSDGRYTQVRPMQIERTIGAWYTPRMLRRFERLNSSSATRQNLRNLEELIPPGDAALVFSSAAFAQALIRCLVIPGFICGGMIGALTRATSRSASTLRESLIVVGALMVIVVVLASIYRAVRLAQCAKIHRSVD